MADIRTELNNVGKGATGERRRKYFLWKNKMDTLETTYSTMTKEKFIEWACEGVVDRFNRLIRWEESDKFKELMYILHKDNFDTDILDVYNAIKDEAMKGNSTAVKTMIDMQKEINKRLKDFSSPDVEDDGLKLDI